jgi:mRNA-degrading endonuclease RelE of RelBE toxin-antitoxin system
MSNKKRKVWVHGACVADELHKLPRKRWRSIVRKLEEGAPADPLHGALEGLERITNGDCRAVYELATVEGQEVVRVLHVGYRSTVYSEAEIVKRLRD